MTIDKTDQAITTNLPRKNRKILSTNLRGTQKLLKLSAGVLSGLNSNNNFFIDGSDTSDIRIGTNSVSDALTTGTSGVQTAATGDDIGDLFEYKIAQPMTVLRNRSALIPIVQTKMEGEKVSIYNEAVRKDRPLSGMRLVNNTSLTFESGSLTVIDRNAYAGEALMKRLKPKEQRLISFALDLGTHVRVRQKRNNERAKVVKVVNGVFQVHYFREEEKLYQISNQTDRTKTLFVEYPIRRGWKLSDKTPKPKYTTQRFYRFRVELKPFEKKELLVSEKRPLMTGYRLTSLTRSNLELFIARRYINSATQAKLEKLIDLRAKMAQINVKLQSFENEEEKISDDQERLRKNIEALSKTAEAKLLIARYIKKVDSQETRLEEISKERRQIQQDRVRLRNKLAQEIRDFELN